ncbi:MAG TPA: hypothetical protein VJT82_11300, partial [Pyrinomonadaceae bacterium]|nr:hypothetical protein [Pyrinomonadaceae bacterium]
MNKNILLCIAGLALGFGVGFFIANKMTHDLRPPASATTARNASDSAPPLDAEQSGAPLPPGHPDISGAQSGDAADANPNGVAATNADAQAAMEAADRKPKD